MGWVPLDLSEPPLPKFHAPSPLDLSDTGAYKGWSPLKRLSVLMLCASKITLGGHFVSYENGELRVFLCFVRLLVK